MHIRRLRSSRHVQAELPMLLLLGWLGRGCAGLTPQKALDHLARCLVLSRVLRCGRRRTVHRVCKLGCLSRPADAEACVTCGGGEVAALNTTWAWKSATAA